LSVSHEPELWLDTVFCCRQRSGTRDRDRARGRAGGSSSWQKPSDRGARGDPRDSRNSRNIRPRDARRSPDDRRDKEMHRGSSKQPRSDRRDEKDRYPVNDQGIVVSPDNIKRAREHREVKNVDGKWVKPEDTGETLVSPALLDGSFKAQIHLPQDALRFSIPTQKHVGTVKPRFYIVEMF